MLAKLFVLHFIADFILQPREMGKKKSTEWRWLAAHLSIQFVIFLFVGWKFALENAIIHGVIDWNVWRLYKLYAHMSIEKSVSVEYCAKLLDDHMMTQEERKTLYDSKVIGWQYWEDHLFYTTIGFDQLLHMLTLYYLSGWLL